MFTATGTVFAAGTAYEQLQAAVKAVRDARDSSNIYINVEGFEVCNDMTADEFLKLLKKYIIPEENETEATLYTEDDYRIHNATAEKEGYIDCNANFVCGDRSQKEGVTVKIPKITGETAYKSEDRVNIEADKAAIKEYIKKVSTTNDTTKEKLLNGINTAVVNGSEVSWDEFDKKEATENHTGYIKRTIKLALNSENPQVEKILMPGNDANKKR